MPIGDFSRKHASLITYLTTRKIAVNCGPTQKHSKIAEPKSIISNYLIEALFNFKSDGYNSSDAFFDS